MSFSPHINMLFRRIARNFIKWFPYSSSRMSIEQGFEGIAPEADKIYIHAHIIYNT